jgi:hypothetical protein
VSLSRDLELAVRPEPEQEPAPALRATRAEPHPVLPDSHPALPQVPLAPTARHPARRPGPERRPQPGHPVRPAPCSSGDSSGA